MAQGLAGSPTKTIGVIIDELSNHFFIEIAEGVDSILQNENYSMQLSSSRWVEDRELRLTRSLLSSRVEGVLIAPVNPDSPSVRLLKSSGIPFVVMNCSVEDPDVAYVSGNNLMGGELVANFINKHPREQIVLISGYPHQSLTDRLNGFLDKLETSYKPIHIRGVKTFEEGHNLVPLLLTRNLIAKIKTTLFVTNDNVAIGITDRLVREGVAIPDQVEIIGYDDIRLSAFSRVPLTTVSQSMRDMGRIAAMELLDLIKDPKKERPRHNIEPRLVIRESAVETSSQ